ncbi:MAG: hypothetical protein M1823_002389 [Watsoniomyces obsoletus]|nr:MAG: hypothetical protein M1823_002389 [Watsoniomyces obsoletus]
MRQCLTSPEGGYYTSKRETGDQFGEKGDFITSPEISQIFGELVGIWFVAEWIAQGRPLSGVQMIELGPGRGTLMSDMLRTFRRLGMLHAISTIYLVEASPSLRKTQHETLCDNALLKETHLGFSSTSQRWPNVSFVWVDELRRVPKNIGSTPFIIAHEFFDALPIHVFQSVAATSSPVVTGAPKLFKKNLWRELVVSPAPAPSSTLQTTSAAQDSNRPEFQVSVSQTPTPHALLLPQISPRYQAMLEHQGSMIEISPEARTHAEDIARRIGSNQPAGQETTAAPGAALIIDYGPASTIPVNSLRGIRGHRNVSPFSSPGLVDVSADVDFTGLAEAALNASPGVEVHGPVEQGDFLRAMGIKERAQQLLEKVPKSDEDLTKRIDSAWQRLVDRGGGGMGKTYKAMAIVPATGGKRRPVGFGGTLL